MSFATQTEPLISAMLEAAASRDVSIMLLTEKHVGNPGYPAAGTPVPGLDAIRLHWPVSQRSPRATLHAKIIVDDDRIALVGNANLTSGAMETNLECGILIRGGQHPRTIRDHIVGLRLAGILRPI